MLPRSTEIQPFVAQIRPSPSCPSPQTYLFRSPLLARWLVPLLPLILSPPHTYLLTMCILDATNFLGTSDTHPLICFRWPRPIYLLCFPWGMANVRRFLHIVSDGWGRPICGSRVCASIVFGVAFAQIQGRSQPNSIHKAPKPWLDHLRCQTSKFSSL